MYADLQQKTVPVAVNLQTYSATQTMLLPNLVTTEYAISSHTTVAMYLTANTTLIERFKKDADAVFDDRYCSPPHPCAQISNYTLLSLLSYAHLPLQ